MKVFLSPQELHDRVQSGKKQTVLACLWEAEEGKAWSKFQTEHIPTAVFCDPESALTGLPGRRAGRNPLPSLQVIDAAVEAWGIEQDRPVIIYDDGSGVFAARAWWILRWAGLQHVHILDGGYRAWLAAGLPRISGPGNVVVPREVELTGGGLPVASMEDVKDFQGVLLDARGPKRFAGRREILDLKAGHIPGAVNLDVQEFFDPQTRKIRSINVIRDAFAAVGVTQNTPSERVITYSGSGNHSALLIAAMEHAGLPAARHYVAGWSQWSAQPENRVATAL